MRPLTVWPLAKRSFRRLVTSVDSALEGRKLEVSSLVSSVSFDPSGSITTTSKSQTSGTTHLVRRPETMPARTLRRVIVASSPHAASRQWLPRPRRHRRVHPLSRRGRAGALARRPRGPAGRGRGPDGGPVAAGEARGRRGL